MTLTGKCQDKSGGGSMDEYGLVFQAATNDSLTPKVFLPSRKVGEAMERLTSWLQVVRNYGYDKSVQ